MSIVSDLIGRLGGNKQVGELLGVGSSAVSNWRRLGIIPPRHLLAIRDLCAAQEIPFDDVVFREVPRTSREDVEAAA